MSLNEYRLQSEDKGVLKKKGVLILATHDSLLASNKLLSGRIEALTKRLEVQEVAKFFINGVSCNFCEQAHEVVHIFQQVWGYLKRISTIWVHMPDNNEILTPTLSIPAAQTAKKFQGVETIIFNHRKKPMKKNQRKILKKS